MGDHIWNNNWIPLLVYAYPEIRLGKISMTTMEFLFVVGTAVSNLYLPGC